MRETARIIDEYFTLERPCPPPLEIDDDIVELAEYLIDEVMPQHDYWLRCLERCPNPYPLKEHFAEVLQRARNEREL
jgi:hypothetical protein